MSGRRSATRPRRRQRSCSGSDARSLPAPRHRVKQGSPVPGGHSGCREPRQTEATRDGRESHAGPAHGRHSCLEVHSHTSTCFGQNVSSPVACLSLPYDGDWTGSVTTVALQELAQGDRSHRTDEVLRREEIRRPDRGAVPRRQARPSPRGDGAADDNGRSERYSPSRLRSTSRARWVRVFTPAILRPVIWLTSGGDRPSTSRNNTIVR